MPLLSHQSNSPLKAIPRNVVLTGNPNSGKTTLFNALTGLRAKVGNYPGVTVERKEGQLLGVPKEKSVVILDLPGTYSLSPQSLDEQISRDVLFHRLPEVPPPDLVIVVVDASNLQRNLYFTTQVIELGYPVIVALNMMDVARENGLQISATYLGQALGAPVIPIIANTGQGLPELRKEILCQLNADGRRSGQTAVSADSSPNDTVASLRRSFCKLPEPFEKEVKILAKELAEIYPDSHFDTRTEAQLVLSDPKCLASNAARYPEPFLASIHASRHRLDKSGLDWRSVSIEARYAWITEVQLVVTNETSTGDETLSDKLDRVITHKFWGLIIFVALMALMFQCIFSFAQIPMAWIQSGLAQIGSGLSQMIPPGPLQDLIVRGVVEGVGAVVVFLPQICLLFLFIGLLEDTGYMARAAFLMDRLMSKVGLHGKSFIPMLSSFACAIPGIMATRTIESPKDRLVTILVAPLMSCSARLPVYTLLIAACIPNQRVFGFIKLPGLTLMGMYLLGIIVALSMAWLFKKTLLKGPTPLLIMELPPYKRPLLRVVLHHMWDRSKIFLRRAGTVILGINILLWFLAYYPNSSDTTKGFEAKRQAVQAANALQGHALEQQLSELNRQEKGERLRNSFAGYLGRALEPVIAPLGFDWKIGIGLVASFAAREVFVSTMSLVYNVGEVDDPGNEQGLVDTMQRQKRINGAPLYTPLLGVTLMVFYVFALQCVSTVAIVRRETNTWKWPFFQWAYMGALAWILAFITYQGGKLLGY